mmetsp:Transcript_11270/g.15183  ORF Transcript_11270/g.15183 Transcript_11270/m.15183 type:complete len:152 (-) Transcript_11270:338-793(-)|eukprot:CAMPEP_0185596552 /NCGR_PEP_ID=MMETSP0434-20130131/80824_1 /TAXON_ID=626734 ORGANISM="Favella taraikaensis, Strain Fe Narragansett Bay" /NCGR_SAMPLE_ID=MMETSP0434 /ASSEMBLY_ACC=CAM_ASM_000379 /LENGTH=151 /DNA_ID=CAMNT_0028225073 /DNA_START=836 /DNA_END=1291 /DNA_ORIENTATION=-
MTSFTINDSKMMLLKQPRRPKSLLETVADPPIRDNKYLIVKSAKQEDGTEIPIVLKEFKINKKLMKADVRNVQSDKYAPLVNKSYVSLPVQPMGTQTRNHEIGSAYVDKYPSLQNSSSRLSTEAVFKASGKKDMSIRTQSQTPISQLKESD